MRKLLTVKEAGEKLLAMVEKMTPEEKAEFRKQLDEKLPSRNEAVEHGTKSGNTD